MILSSARICFAIHPQVCKTGFMTIDSMPKSPKKESADALDILIGRKIKFRRKLLGMTQQDLASKLNISFQQVQKYETGENKIYAGRLYHISQILKTPLQHFFEDDTKSGLSDQSQDGFLLDDPMDKSETAILVRIYYDIQDKKKRKTALDMMKGLQ